MMQKLENQKIGIHCILACLYFLLLPTTIAVNSSGNSILKLATIPIGLFFAVTLILSNRKLRINGVHLALLLYTLSVVVTLFCDSGAESVDYVVGYILNAALYICITVIPYNKEELDLMENTQILLLIILNRLTYATVSDEIREEGIGHQIMAFFGAITFPGADRILDAVAECYQEIYASSYLTYDAMFVIDWASIDVMDYYNRAEALRTEAMRILRFLQDKEDKSIINETALQKLTYGDLSNDLWQLIRVDIENHQAYIVQNSITASREELLRQFRYMEEIYVEEMERRTEEYLVLDAAVDMYDSTTTKVVFIPALDQDNSFYMNRTKIGLDYLVESADAARLAADEAEHNAKYYQYLQSCFTATVTPKESQIAHADAIYASIKGGLEELIDAVKVLLAESNQTENEGIKVSGAEMSVGVLGVGMSFAKRFVILSMGAYVLLCIPFAFPKKKEEETQEV